MSKGTIIYIGGFELPDKNAAAHRVLSNGKALSNLGYSVVYIGVNKTLPLSTPVLTTLEKVQGFDSWQIPYPNSTKQWISYLTSINPFLEVLSQYSNVHSVICYNYQSIAFGKILNYCKSKKINTYADCTEWYGAQGTNSITKIIKGLDSFIRMRFIHKRIDGMIVISKYLNDYYSQVKNVITIPPLVDLSEEKWINLRKKEINIEKKFVYAGSPGNKDKINLIIKSLDRMKNSFDFSFSIIGIDKKEYLEFYPEDKCFIENLNEKVSFYGRLSHYDSLKKLANSDYSIFFREDNLVSKAGFPTKFVESLSCGVPVITNSTSNINDYLNEGENGYLLNIDSIEEIANKLSDILLKDKGTNNEMSEELRRTFDYRNYLSYFKKIF